MAPSVAPPLADEDEPTSMSERVRRFDWAQTPLGLISDWPPNLRFAYQLIERSPVPMALYWGPDLSLLYNDHWVPFLTDRHPSGLGRPAREVWGAIWPIVGPQFEQVLATGEGLAVQAQRLPAKGRDAGRDSWWDYVYAPVVDEAGAVLGIVTRANEVTTAILTERRLKFQIQLADKLRGLHDPEAVKGAATAMLGEYLGAARIGYADVDEAQGTIAVREDWTRAGVHSLRGQATVLGGFGEQALPVLRAGEPLVIHDVALLPGYAESRETWDRIGARAMINVPLVRGGALKALLYVHDVEPRHWLRSEAAMARDAAERTWAAVERAQAEQALRDSEDHYRHAVELNPQVSWTALPDGQLNRVSQRWHDWTGTPGTGESWAQGLHPDDVERTFAVWRNCVATGDTYDIIHRVKHKTGEYRWARSRAFTRLDERGGILLWYGTTEDVHEQRMAEEHQRLLVNELNHRVKNTLATVQAIAFQTLKGDIDLDEARRLFEARLMALSRAHNLLTERNWEGALLGSVVRDAISHLPPERFRLAGPELWLSPRAALALALALHELGTNAAKHGALSADTGQVSIHWRIDGAQLRLGWQEQGGPPVLPPARRGFGSRLIERGLDSDLGGQAILEFAPEGLSCRIEASLPVIQTREPGLA